MHGLPDIYGPLQELAEAIVALALCMSRWLGLTRIMPVFSRTGLTGLVRGGFSFAMALPALPLGMAALNGLEREDALVTLVLLGIKELLIGVALGLVLGMPFWAAEMAGEFLDVQRGMGGGTGQTDPQGMSQGGVIAAFFSIVAVALFLVAGGVDIIAGAVYDSYRLWPLAELGPRVDDATLSLLVGLAHKMMLIALSVAAPLAITTLASDFLLGYIARLAPSLNSYQMGMAVKSLILALMMPLYAHFMLKDLSTVMLDLRMALPPAAESAP